MKGIFITKFVSDTFVNNILISLSSMTFMLCAYSKHKNYMLSIYIYIVI